MYLHLLTEFQFRLKKCRIEKNYIDTLIWGVEQYKEKKGKIVTKEDSIRDPIAIMVIEIFMVNPGAVEKCAIRYNEIKSIYSRISEEKNPYKLITNQL